MGGRLEDRRAKPRFDIVGHILGALEVVARFPIENIGPGGAQFRCQLPLPVGSVHRLMLGAGRDEFATQVKVRHLTPEPGARGEQSFVVGIEFLSMPRGLMSAIQKWVAISSSDESADV